MSQLTICKVGGGTYLLTDWELAKSIAKYTVSASSRAFGAATEGELDAKVFTEFLSDAGTLEAKTTRTELALVAKDFAYAERIRYGYTLRSLTPAQYSFYWHMYVLIANKQARAIQDFRIAILPYLQYWQNLFATALLQELPNVPPPKLKELKDERTGFLTTAEGSIYRSSFGEIELLE